MSKSIKGTKTEKSMYNEAITNYIIEAVKEKRETQRYNSYEIQKTNIQN
ncbi:hypothetical protein KKC91_07485 [bacterium]|nr:hypothetical protein [bacterium]